MSAQFEAAIAKIRAQQDTLNNLDERAVELGAVLPILKQLGWDTEDMNQIYPQLPLGEPAAEGKVDYSLRAGSETRVLVEVKRWSHKLDEGAERQLRAYCQADKTKTKLAVLTNGRRWRLFLPPTAKKGELRQFLDRDLLTGTAEFEKDVSRYLLRSNLDAAGQLNATLKAARAEFNRQVKEAQETLRIAEAVSRITRESLVKVVQEQLEQETGQEAPAERIREVLAEREVEVVSKVPGTPKGKKFLPKSFTLQTEEGPVRKEFGKQSGWRHVLSGIGELMLERHPGDFQRITEVKGFSDAKELKGHLDVGNTGIQVKDPKSAVKFEELCHAVLLKFGYLPSGLRVV